MNTKRTNDNELLRMALIGFEIQSQKILDKIGELRSRIRLLTGQPLPDDVQVTRKKGTVIEVPWPPDNPMTQAMIRRRGRKFKLSVAARRRISAAQKKRWADYHKKKSAARRK